MPYTYEYPRPCVSVDCIIFKEDEVKQVLLIKRKNPPFEGKWALPGGFLDMHETLEEAALRELKEETGVTGVTLTQLHSFSRVDRDPRARVITVAFYGFLKESSMPVKGRDDAIEAKWFDIGHLPPLAFDHDEMIEMALERTGAS